jgi:[ribosomal protein S18]-alanine N-acetyltransferase
MREDLEGLEIRRLTTEWKRPLLFFLSALDEAGDADFFLPHAFTEQAVERILLTARKDLYYVLADGTQVLGYGMLRGWDEGYAIPSLGIAIHPRFRGAGIGRIFMHFLGAAAKFRGASRIRLRVKAKNTKAAKLYESLGYEFCPEEEGEYRVGFLDLRHASR